MAKKDDRLVVYERIYKLIFYTNNLLQKYPKAERFALCDRIKNIELMCLENVMYAWKETNSKVRFKLLLDVDVKLYVLKTLTRISYESKYINDKNYVALDNQINEIGKMVGAWRKKCQNV